MPSDLVIDAIVLPPVVTAPCPTTVEVVVRNAGSDRAPYPFAVCVQIAAGAEEPFSPEYVRRVTGGEGGLLPGQTVTVNFAVVFPCRSQSWAVAEADCRHNVAGNLRSNPRMTLPVPSVVLVPWLFTEIRVGLKDSSGTIIWEPSQLCADLDVVVQIEVSNRGCADAPASTTELLVTGSAGPVASVSSPTPTLTPGKYTYIQHVLQLPPPAPSPVTIQACADTGGVVTDQCDTANLCRSKVMLVSPGSGSPYPSLTVDGPVVPGQPPTVSWSVLNDCSDLGTVEAAIFFGPDELYRSAPIPIAPLGEAGEQHVALTVPASAKAGLYTFGQNPLELHVTSPGAPGATFKATAQLQVNPEIPRSTWAWILPPLGPLVSTAPGKLAIVESWRAGYSVGGTLTNSSGWSAMTASAISITETADVAGIATAGAMPITAPGSPIMLGASSALGSPVLFQSWTWCDPWTFYDRGPDAVTFTYVATFTLTDEFGNAYPATSSPPLDAVVRVPLAKQQYAVDAYAFMLTMAGFVAIAASVVALGPYGAIAAAACLVLAFAAWGMAIWFKAKADDPPVPDFGYQERVEVRPAAHDLRREDAPPWADSMATVIELMERVRASSEALSGIHAKLLGARVDGDAEALRMQADDYRAALARLQAAAEQVPNAIAHVLPDLEADELLSPERFEAAVEEWRSGKTLDEGRRLWRDNQLPEEAFDDLVERIAHLETVPPLEDALGAISEATMGLAKALGEEATEVLAVSERPVRNRSR